MQKGFFASLFDVSFTSFITTKIIKVVYIIILVVISIAALVFIGAAFSESSAAGVLTLVIFAPLGWLLYVIYARIALEVIIQIFRITEQQRDQTEMQRQAFTAAGWLPPERPEL